MDVEAVGISGEASAEFGKFFGRESGFDFEFGAIGRRNNYSNTLAARASAASA
jgi:hypothetical protein